MFYNETRVATKYFDKIGKVRTKKELKTFLRTFDECYKKDDPQNPYGEVGGFLKETEEQWYQYGQTGNVELFIAYKDGLPVATAILTSLGGLGYISAVGSLQQVRGEGYGKAITLYCVKRSHEKGNLLTFLATEEGQYPNEFYKRIGFVTRFTATAYCKD